MTAMTIDYMDGAAARPTTLDRLSAALRQVKALPSHRQPDGRELQAMAQTLHGLDEASQNHVLAHAPTLDAASRIALKAQAEMQAQGRVSNKILTDTPTSPRGKTLMQHDKFEWSPLNRTLREYGFQANRTYTERDVDQILEAAQLDVTSRLVAKLQLEECGLLVAPQHAQAGDLPGVQQLLKRAGIRTDRGYSESEINALLDRAGLDLAESVAVMMDLKRRNLVYA